MNWRKGAILGLIVLVGSYLRLWNLGIPPLWVDECLFVRFLDVGAKQEFIPVWIYGLFKPTTEFWIRFPFAVAGILTIPAIYFAMRNKVNALCLAALYATFPFFVFWSRLARPYVFVGLFVVLAWRWWPFYFAGLLSSPVALLGLNLSKIKQKKYWLIYGLVLLCAMALYLIRPDTDRTQGFFSLDYLKTAKRQFYVPTLMLLVYLFEFGFPYLGQACARLQDGEDLVG